MAEFIIALCSAIAATLVGFAIPPLVRFFKNRSDPVTATVQVHPIRNEESGLQYGFPEPLNLSASEIDDLNEMDRQKFLEWVQIHGGVQVGHLRLTVTISGNRSQPVEVTGIHVKKTCKEPLTGAYMLGLSGLGEGPVIGMAFDLKEPVPVAHKYVNYEPSGNYFNEKKISLAPNEQQTLIITVSSDNKYCSFTFEMAVVDAGRVATVTIDDHGRPFALTPDLTNHDETHLYAAYRDLYLGGVITGGDWVRENPAAYGPW
ncbi:hypothetical protein ACIP2Y_01745 [Streptomyces sviceus]|uniref:hypothetical protein n=1 Tax=Streptomyces sviceus TaxID=285530 RepID=UPI0037F3472D